MKRILLFILTLNLFTHFSAQETQWEVYLQGESIHSIDFDNEFVWAATDSFLVKLNTLDGSTTYYPYLEIMEDMSVLLKIDNDGGIWIAQTAGSNPAQNQIYSFDGSNWNEVPFNGTTRIFSFVIDKNNDKWIGTLFGSLYKIEQNTCVQYTPENSGLAYNNVTHIDSDKDGNLWMVNYGNVGDLALGDISIIKYDGNNWNSFWDGSAFAFNSIKIDSKGNPWVQNYWYLKKLDIINNSWSEIIDLDFDMYLFLLSIEGESKFWFCNSDGVALLNGSDWSYYTSSNSSLPSNSVYDIQIDANGTKWIGTELGLASYNENGLLSTNDHSKKINDIILYPNPAKDFITLKVPQGIENIQVSIVNILGETIKRFKTRNNESLIDVSYLDPGIYVLTIHSNQGNAIKKFIKR